MKFEDKHVLDKPAAVVIKMYSDQKFFERKYQDMGAWDIAVLECSKDERRFRIKCRYTIKANSTQIPAAVQKFIGANSTITQTDTWDLAAKTGRLEVEVKGAPVKASADMVLRDEGAGAANLMKWNVSSGIPLVGGMLEKLVVEDIKAKSGQDVAVTRNILKDYS